MAEDQSADFEGLVAREQAENAFRDALCLFVGRGRRYSVAQLAKGSRVAQRKIECFKSYKLGHVDYRKLDFGELLSITKFLGAEFTTEYLRIADQGAFDLPDEDPSPGELAADTTDDSAKIVRAAIDGDFCSKDRAELPAVGVRMMARGAQLVALGRAAA